MNNRSFSFISGLQRIIVQFILKLTQRPDSYPIKHYRKRRRVKYYWHNV
ncbi:MAG: hypothetical protein SFU87_10475 [Chitinophagaceae bacterium]|nr:hypothetical protein [Chitinophagaceae bacterium]